jgi:hypothetical protein
MKKLFSDFSCSFSNGYAGLNRNKWSVKSRQKLNLPPCFIISNLQEFGATNQKAHLTVSHVLGHMYFSGAFGKLVVAIFEWTCPRLLSPSGNNATIIFKDIELPPCN